MFPSTVQARSLSGSSPQGVVRLETEVIDDVEYIAASDVIPYFTDLWNYDGVTGVIVFYRNDGQRVGLRIGEARAVVGDRIFANDNPPIRQRGQVYIPFYTVDTLLFPRVTFSEGGLAPTPTPESSFDDDPFGEPSPSPTPPPFQYVPWGQPSPTPDFYSPSVGPPQENWVVVLDPGNDDTAPGARGMLSQREADLTLAVCEQMERILLEDGRFEVALTRRRGDSVDNINRAAAANRAFGSIFISVQCGRLHNADISRAAVYFMNHELDAPPAYEANAIFIPGLQTWHDAYRRHVIPSRALGQTLLDELDALYRTTNLIKTDAEPRPGRLAALRGLGMPGVVVELGNLSHAATARYLSSERIQLELADSLSAAVANYFSESQRRGAASR